MQQTTWMVLIGTVGVLGSSLPGCKPKEGASCDEGATACVDEHNKLSCEDGPPRKAAHAYPRPLKRLVMWHLRAAHECLLSAIGHSLAFT